jgi:hypothetical protein
MKTTKLFFMAALALMTAACSNDDNDLTTQQPQKAEGITITAQLAPKTNGADTRAVVDNGDNKITATWAVDEHIAILYEVNSTPTMADATITAVDGDGKATITFTVEAGTENNTACKLVYPATINSTLPVYKNDFSDVKDAAEIFGYVPQDGTLSANLDIRRGYGTIQTTTPGLTVTTEPVAQYAIFKFTAHNSVDNPIDVSFMEVYIGSLPIIIIPSGSSEFYAALPAASSQPVGFFANCSDGYYYCYKSSATFAAGKFYQSTLKMSAIVEAKDYDGTFVDAGFWDSGSFEGKTITVAEAQALAAYMFHQSGDPTAFIYANPSSTNLSYVATNDGGSFTTGTVAAGDTYSTSALYGYSCYMVSKD